MSDPNQAIPGPDPGACDHCGGWRKAGMVHDCEAERNALRDDYAMAMRMRLEQYGRAERAEAEVERLRSKPCPWCSYPKEPQTP